MSKRWSLKSSKIIFIWVLLMLGLPSLGTTSDTYPEKNYLKPYWDSDTMYHESVLMVSDSGKPAEASLLFPALAIQSVQNAGLDTMFREGVDWSYANGKLKLLAGSKAAFLTQATLYPKIETPGWTQGKVGGGYILFQESHYFHDRQLSVTYSHARNLWKGPVPKFATINLAKTLSRLTQSLPVKIVFIGNSITAGYNASGFTGALPNVPAYPGLVVNNLRANYSSVLTFKNVAVAGKDAAWGASNVRTLVTAENPDLVIISFGMNDGSAKVSSDIFLSRIVEIMADVKTKNPAVEFILVATTLANPETFFSGNQSEYKAKLQTLVGSGIELVDMTGVHQELLQHKAFRDMTGNNVNHPNDFLHRWYAQQMSGLLIKPIAVSLAQSNWLSRPVPINRFEMFSVSYLGTFSLPLVPGSARVKANGSRLNSQTQSRLPYRWIDLKGLKTE